MSAVNKRIFQAIVVSGSRARLTRKRDAKSIYGWARTIEDDRFTLETSCEMDFAVGDEFVLEVSGKKYSLLCHTTLEHVFQKGILSFKALGTPKVIEASQQLRIQVSNVEGTALYNGSEIPLTLVDVAPGGIGFVSSVPFAKGDRFGVQVNSSFGIVSLVVTVRHCRPIEAQGSKFRVGAQIAEVGRVDSGRFLRFFEDAA